MDLSGRRPPSREKIENMVAQLQHRGPDESGLFLDDAAALGHARLSVIDLTTGTQPMGNEDGTLWIVCNGEIYNHPELRTSLRRAGHAFRTTSDTEVILHLYEEYGAKCLDDLNGQFAFAIWDTKRRSLFLARDRFGIRPLFYANAAGQFLFASEIKAIFALPDVSRSLDPEGIDQVFTYWTTLPGNTAFRGVADLPPAHYMDVKPRSRHTHRYWLPPLGSPGPRPALTRETAAAELHDLLEDAVKLRLRADVPVGTYLSGGLDSSGVTALASHLRPQGVHSFGIHFENEEFDESTYQAHVARHLGVTHSTIRVGDDDIGSRFRQVMWHAETPMLRTAPSPLFLLSAHVHDSGLKVVLTGEGADELFGGYNIFKETKIRYFWSRRPQSTSRGRLCERLYPYLFRDQRTRQSLQSFFRRGLETPDDPFFSHRIRWESTARAKMFFTRELRAGGEGRPDHEALRQWLPERFASWDVLSRAQYLEVLLFLPGYLLSSQGDRMAMAHALEIRLPYLDHRVADFMAGMPPAWRIRALKEKYLLKKSLGKDLPGTIVRRPKTPYRTPVGRPLLSGPALDVTRDLLSPRRLKEAGFFHEDKVHRLLEKTCTSQNVTEFEGMALTGILSTQWLHHLFVASNPPQKRRLVNLVVLVDRRTGAQGAAATHSGVRDATRGV